MRPSPNALIGRTEPSAALLRAYSRRSCDAVAVVVARAHLVDVAAAQQVAALVADVGQLERRVAQRARARRRGSTASCSASAPSPRVRDAGRAEAVAEAARRRAATAVSSVRMPLVTLVNGGLPAMPRPGLTAARAGRTGRGRRGARSCRCRRRPRRRPGAARSSIVLLDQASGSGPPLPPAEARARGRGWSRARTAGRCRGRCRAPG